MKNLSLALLLFASFTQAQVRPGDRPVFNAHLREVIISSPDPFFNFDVRELCVPTEKDCLQQLYSWAEIKDFNPDYKELVENFASAIDLLEEENLILASGGENSFSILIVLARKGSVTSPNNNQYELVVTIQIPLANGSVSKSDIHTWYFLEDEEVGTDHIHTKIIKMIGRTLMAHLDERDHNISVLAPAISEYLKTDSLISEKLF